MTRNGQSLAKAISGLRSNLSHYDSYLFVVKPSLFLRGFALDVPSDGCYVWKYMFPLFCDHEFLNLTFGYRLEHGYVSFSGQSKTQIISSVLSVIDYSYNFNPEESFSEFLEFVEDPRISKEAFQEATTLLHSYEELGIDRVQHIAERNAKRYFA